MSMSTDSPARTDEQRGAASLRVDPVQVESPVLWAGLESGDGKTARTPAAKTEAGIRSSGNAGEWRACGSGYAGG